MKKKIIGIFVCMLMMTTGVISVSGIVNMSDEKKSSPLEIPEGHIIENVPYVSQGDSWYCAFATATMIFQYYGINASLFEVLFNSGVGYSSGYKITWPCIIHPGVSMCIDTKDRLFLAEIYGLNFSFWYCNDKSVSDEKRWQMYWANVKENISQNIPVIAGVMLEDLPYIPYEPGGHAILLVGFNETNNTVCLHDSYAGVVNKSINGDYIYLPIDVLKESTKSADDRFYFEIFEKTGHMPLSKKEAFELAHSRNIQKMKGDAKVYPKFSLVPIYGIHALTFLKHSITIRNLPLSNFIGKSNEIYDYLSTYNYNMIYLEKHNMSQYLIEHADLYPNALFEGEMLDIEAHNWLLLNYTMAKLSSILFFRIPAKISGIKEIRDILEVIISIEKDIIAGAPPAVSIRSIAEFESVDELIITWPKWYSIRGDGLIQDPYMIDLIKAAEDSVRVRINVNNLIIKLSAISKLKKAGVPLNNITFSRIRTSSMWCRDYGPYFIEKNGELSIVDFNYYGLRWRLFDNLYPTFYGIKNKIQYSFRTNFILCLSSGNYMTDGHGRAMIGDIPLHADNNNRFLTNEEIKDILKLYLGLDEVYIFKSQKDDGTGHIDMFSKLLDENTVLVGEWDASDENYQILEDNAINFSNLGFNVIRIPMLRDPNPENNTIWSYTNSVIINGTHKKVVLVPQYNVPEDSIALSIYQQAMPEYEIRGIDCRTIISCSGAIHCTTFARPLIN